MNYIKKIKPSERNELEVVDLLNEYLKNSELNLKFLEDLVWLDTGNANNLLTASNL